MSFLNSEKYEYSFYEKILSEVLKRRFVPRHIAFIMDGNRRYAKARNADVSVGHEDGYKRAKKVILWCKDIGVKEVSLYAFSVENFNRTSDEVRKLMELIEKAIDDKLENLPPDECIRVFGCVEMLPQHIQDKCRLIVEKSANRKEFYINICLAYTSRHEMTNAMNKMMHGVKNNLIDANDLDVQLMDSLLYTSETGGPDMILRSSGEVRLSDFYLWQSIHSLLAFESVSWPEMGYINFALCILYYQQKCDTLRKFAEKQNVQSKKEKIIKFLEKIRSY